MKQDADGDYAHEFWEENKARQDFKAGFIAWEAFGAFEDRSHPASWSKLFEAESGGSTSTCYTWPGHLDNAAARMQTLTCAR